MKTLFTFLNESLDINQPVKLNEVKLYQLSFYTMPIKNRVCDLRQYFVDEHGDVYTQNNATPFTRFGLVLKKCSNNSFSKHRLINTFRDTLGTKVTISRKKIVEMINNNELDEVSSGAILKIT